MLFKKHLKAQPMNQKTYNATNLTASQRRELFTPAFAKKDSQHSTKTATNPLHIPIQKLNGQHL